MSRRGGRSRSVDLSRREQGTNNARVDGSFHTSSLTPEAIASSSVGTHKTDRRGNGGVSAGSNGLRWSGKRSSVQTSSSDRDTSRGQTVKDREQTGSIGGGSVGGTGGMGGRTEKLQYWRTQYDPNKLASVRRPSERVTLNLSGTLFVTTRDTLARNPDTYFAAMLRMHPPPDDGCDSGSSSAVNGGGGGSGGPGGDDSAGGSSSSSNGVEFFIDRDPTHFRFILNYLRDSYIGLDSFGEADLHFLEELSHEAEFFNISGLCADISRRISEIARKQREGPSGDKDFRLVQCNIGQIQALFHEWVIEKNYEFECMQIVGETAYVVLGRRVSRGELALVERLMKT